MVHSRFFQWLYYHGKYWHGNDFGRGGGGGCQVRSGKKGEGVRGGGLLALTGTRGYEQSDWNQ